MREETKHSPEPWSEGEDGEILCAIPSGEEGEAVVSDFVSLLPGDLRRIVACVNACAGIPVEALEIGALGEALSLADITTRCSDTDGVEELRDLLRRLGRMP